MAAKMRRWKCPKCGKGALAPSRPRKDDIRRYCLPCSQETGRLVGRVCPALEAGRSASAEKQAEKAREARARVRADRMVTVTEVDGSESEFDCVAFVRKCCRLPSVRKALPKLARPGNEPVLKIRRGGKSHLSGHAKAWQNEIVVTVPREGAKRESVEELLLHEVCHRADWRSNTAHAEPFRRLLRQAARELWPGVVPGPADLNAYEIDARIVASVRAMRIAEIGPDRMRDRLDELSSEILNHENWEAQARTEARGSDDKGHAGWLTENARWHARRARHKRVERDHLRAALGEAAK